MSEASKSSLLRLSGRAGESSGLITMCIGGGMGFAMIVEKM